MELVLPCLWTKHGFWGKEISPQMTNGGNSATEDIFAVLFAKEAK